MPDIQIGNDRKKTKEAKADFDILLGVLEPIYTGATNPEKNNAKNDLGVDWGTATDSEKLDAIRIVLGLYAVGIEAILKKLDL